MLHLTKFDEISNFSIWHLCLLYSKTILINLHMQVLKGGINMETKALNAALAVDFSLIGTQLHLLYKSEGNGYKFLLIPSPQVDNRGISIDELLKDIGKLTKAASGNASGGETQSKELEDVLNGAIQSGTGNEDGTKPKLEDIRIILNMAYIYVCKDEKSEADSTVEYAFNLEVLTSGLIPAALTDIFTVDRVSIAVWNTERTQILSQMSIAKIEDYLGLPANDTPSLEPGEDTPSPEPGGDTPSPEEA